VRRERVVAVSDPLGRLHEAASRLLAEVDETLARWGAPDHHPIWPLIRAIGLLPGEAVVAVETLSWDAFRQRADLMHSHHERGTSVGDLLAAPSGWEGPAAEAAGAKLESARAGVQTLTTNAGVLAQLMGELAEWGMQGRLRLARTLAKVITSGQAVDLTMEEAEPAERARAAADIGAEVLAEVAGFWSGAREIAREGLARLETEAASDVTAAASTGTQLAVEFK
jgi:hypothetical protein